MDSNSDSNLNFPANTAAKSPKSQQIPSAFEYTQYLESSSANDTNEADQQASNSLPFSYTSSYPSIQIFSSAKAVKTLLNIPNHILHIHNTNSLSKISSDSVHLSTPYTLYPRALESWRVLNPTHVQLLFDRNDGERVLIGSFHPAVMATYEKLPLVTQRKSLLKFILLYHFGGVYASMGIEAQMSVSDLWIPEDVRDRLYDSGSYQAIRAIIGMREVQGSVEDSNGIGFSTDTIAFDVKHNVLEDTIRTVVAFVSQETIESLDEMASIIEDIFENCLVRFLLKTSNVGDILAVTKETFGLFDDVLILGSSYFNGNWSTSLTANLVQSNLPPDAIRSSNIFESSPFLVPIPPTIPIIRTTNITEIPNHILRTFYTRDRLEIKQSSINGSDFEWRWLEFIKWENVNPGHLQIMFDDDCSDRFVKSVFESRIVEAYFKLPRVVQRADLTRYLMLYKYGGVYTDMDTSAELPFEEWFRDFININVIIGVENANPNIDDINQWTIAAAPEHPLIGLVIQAVVEAIEAASVDILNDVDFGVIDITGPGIWKRVVWGYIMAIDGNLSDVRELVEGIRVFDDVMLVGKAYMNPEDIYVRHFFSGFHSKRGWKNKKPEFGPHSLHN